MQSNAGSGEGRSYGYNRFLRKYGQKALPKTYPGDSIITSQSGRMDSSVVETRKKNQKVAFELSPVETEHETSSEQSSGEKNDQSNQVATISNGGPSVTPIKVYLGPGSVKPKQSAMKRRRLFTDEDRLASTQQLNAQVSQPPGGGGGGGQTPSQAIVVDTPSTTTTQDHTSKESLGEVDIHMQNKMRRLKELSDKSMMYGGQSSGRGYNNNNYSGGRGGTYYSKGGRGGGNNYRDSYAGGRGQRFEVYEKNDDPFGGEMDY